MLDVSIKSRDILRALLSAQLYLVLALKVIGRDMWCFLFMNNISILMKRAVDFLETNHMKNLRAYYFGHLKSTKCSENGRLCREKFLLPKEWEF